MNDWAVLGDVQESDFALVLALVRGHDVLDVELRVGPVVVDHQLTPETFPERFVGRYLQNYRPLYMFLLSVSKDCPSLCWVMMKRQIDCLTCKRVYGENSLILLAKWMGYQKGPYRTLGCQ